MTECSGQQTRRSGDTDRVPIRPHHPSAVGIVPEGRLFNDPNFWTGLPEVSKNVIKDVEGLEEQDRGEAYHARIQEILSSAVADNYDDVVLHQVIPLAAMAVRYVKSPTDEGSFGWILALAKAIEHKFCITRLDEDLDDAIFYLGKARQLIPKNPKRYEPMFLEEVGSAYMELYNLTVRDNIFDLVEMTYNEAIEAAKGTPLEPHMLSQLGTLIVHRSSSSLTNEQIEQSLNRSIHLCSFAIKALTVENPDVFGTFHKKLAEAYTVRYKISRNEEDFDHAKEAYAASLRLLWGSPCEKIEEWISRVLDLAELQIAKYRNCGVVDFVNDGIFLTKAALTASGDDWSRRSSILVRVAALVKERANNQENSSRSMLNVLSECVELVEEAAVIVPADDTLGFVEAILSCSRYLAERYDLGKVAQDLDVAIELQHNCIDLCSLNSLDSSPYRILLAQLLATKSDRDRNKAPLDEALERLYEATAPDQPLDPRLPFLEGRIIKQLYEYTGDTANLQKAEKPLDKAAMLCTQSDQILQSQCYFLLGSIQMLLFDRTNELVHSKNAILHHEQALAVLQPLESFRATLAKADSLCCIGEAHLSRFYRFSELEDVNASIESFRNSINLIDEKHSGFVEKLCCFKAALEARFESTGDPADIDEASRRIQDCLNFLIAETDKGNRARLLNAIGELHMAKYRRMGRQSGTEVDAAISHFIKASNVDYLDSWSFHLAIRFNHAYAQSQKAHLERTNDAFDIAYGIYAEIGADLDPLSEFKGLVPERPDSRIGQIYQQQPSHELEARLWSVKHSMAELCYEWYLLSPSPEIRHIALAYFSSIFPNQSLKPDHRTLAALKSALLFHSSDDRQASDVMLGWAIVLLQETFSTTMGVLDHIHLAREFRIVPEACIALSLDNKAIPWTVVQRFELCKGFLWDRLLESNDLYEDLQEKHPELLASFRQIQTKLSKMTRTTMRESKAQLGLSPPAFGIEDLNKAMEEYRNVEATIRNETGFEDFMYPPRSEEQLKEYGQHGPVVIVNSHELRSDAMIIGKNCIWSVELPHFDVTSAQRYIQKLQEARAIIEQDLSRATLKLKVVLKWLWFSVVRPILESLDYLQDFPSKPRLWWVASGWISLFPVHAAGDYSHSTDAESKCTTPDYVVSSFTPTLRALESARSSINRMEVQLQHTGSKVMEDTSAKKALLLHVPQKDGQGDLPQTEREIETVETSLSSSYEIFKPLPPSRKTVMSQIKECTLMHIACHIKLDPKDPTLSRILLGLSERDALSIRDFLKRRLPKCQLAYLSACESAMSIDEYLVMECIHFAGALQMSGVPNVIATSWIVDDNVSATIAEYFYQGLRRDDHTLHMVDAARSLHAATQRARQEGANLWHWAGFVHFGP